MTNLATRIPNEYIFRQQFTKNQFRLMCSVVHTESSTKRHILNGLKVKLMLTLNCDVMGVTCQEYYRHHSLLVSFKCCAYNFN